MALALLATALLVAALASGASAAGRGCGHFRTGSYDQAVDILSLRASGGASCASAHRLAGDWVVGSDQNFNEAQFECAPPPGAGVKRCSFGPYRCRSVSPARGIDDVSCRAGRRGVSWRANFHPSTGPF